MSRILVNKPPFGAELDTSHPLARELKAWFLLNEQTGLWCHDISESQAHGQFDEAGTVWHPEWSPSASGGALLFGANAKSRLEAGKIDMPLGRCTVSVWSYAHNNPTNGMLAIMEPINVHWSLFFLGSDIQVRGGGSSDLSTTPQPSANEWHHIVATIGLVGSTGKAEIWVDGVSAGTGDITKIANGGDVQFGMNGVSGSLLFDGLLDNLQIWNRVLSDEEIQEIYSDPYGAIKRARPLFVPSASGAISMSMAGDAVMVMDVKGAGAVALAATADAAMTMDAKGAGAVALAAAGDATMALDVKGTGAVATAMTGTATMAMAVTDLVSGAVSMAMAGDATMTMTVLGTTPAGEVVVLVDATDIHVTTSSDMTSFDESEVQIRFTKP